MSNVAGLTALLLLALAGGFVFAARWWPTRYRILRAEGQQVYLYAALYAVLLMLLSLALLRVATEIIPSGLEESIGGQWSDTLSPYELDVPALPPFVLAFLLGWMGAPLLNHFSKPEKTSKNIINEHGSQLEQFLYGAIIDAQLLFVALDNKRCTWDGPPSCRNYSHVSMLRRSTSGSCPCVADTWNVRPSDAGRRYWNLKGILYCPCGSRLAPSTTRKKSVVHFYYVCRGHRSGKDPCPHAKYHRAEDLEERVRRFVVDLIRNPGTLREQVKAKAERQKQALRRPEKAIRAWARQAADADAERDRYNRLYARGKLSDDEYDAYTSELDRHKAAAEEELHRFEDARRELEVLEALPELVKEYLDWLPHHLEMPIYKTGDRQPDEPLKPYRVAPDTVKPRSPIDRDAMRQRERGVYDDLRLKVTAPRDGGLVAEWSGGRKLLGIPS